MIVGVDPGRQGGLAALSDDGKIVGLWPMPTDGRRVCAVGLAGVYREIRSLAGFDESVRVVIEELYTPPSDATAKKAFSSALELSERCGEYLDACDGDYAQTEHLDRVRAQYAEVVTYRNQQLRLDGRVGLLNYAKGAGMLHMPALWDWPIKEVKPSIWARDLKKGVDKSLSTKEQSLKVAKSIWPEHFDKDHPLTFQPGRCRKPQDGLYEAALISWWGLKHWHVP